MPILPLLPILLILILMVGYRFSAARAGLAGYLLALGIAVAFFGANLRVLGYAHLRALLLSFDVLYIIWSAYLLYRVADEAGAIETIGEALRQLTNDKGMQAILIGWVFASFLQGAGGFGVPVAVTAPLLVGLGFSPLAAVVIPTVGHGWAVTFGSLGSSFNALISSTGLPAEYLAPISALFLGLSALPSGLMVIFLAEQKVKHKGRADSLSEKPKNLRAFFLRFVFKPDGRWGRAWRKLGWQTLLIALTMGGTQYLVAVTLGLWHIGAFAGGMAGLVVGVGSAYWGQASPNPRAHPSGKELFVALSAYLALILFTAGILLFPQIKNIALEIQYPATLTAQGYLEPAGTSKAIPIFGHAGAILLYASGAAFLIYKRAGLYNSPPPPRSTLRAWYKGFSPSPGWRILRQTARKMLKSSLSIALMVSMAMVMQQSGMTEALAQGLAGGIGKSYPFFSAWIGALGAFMTGSNTNSNVIFAVLQMRTAELLGYSVPLILAAQTAGASLASVVAPAKLIVGASTAGMEGKEGEVLRAVIGYAGGLVFFIALLTVLGTLWMR